MDEKGFLIRVLLKIKRIFLKCQYDEGRVKQFIQDSNWEWITTIIYICIDRTALPPALIY